MMLESMQKEFKLLEKALKQACRQGPAYYLANPGNWGDALIRHGALKFLQDIGLDFSELKPGLLIWAELNAYLEKIKSQVRQPGTLIYGGGGGWRIPRKSPNNHAFFLLKALQPCFRKMIVLPSSYEYRMALPKMIFFCRDYYESRTNVPGAFFCHDMAFYLEHRSREKGNGVGYFFRTDDESANRLEIPPENNDISAQGRHGDDVTPFIDELARHAVIHTDRLHVAIAACLLGRELHFYPGSYFKNKAVYLSSIKENFENAYFHG